MPSDHDHAGDSGVVPNGTTVLIVDDNEHVATLLGEYCRAEGMVSDSVVGGTQVLDVLVELAGLTLGVVGFAPFADFLFELSDPRRRGFHLFGCKTLSADQGCQEHGVTP